MWQILLDLLPHFTRLVPLADRYFSNRGEQDKAHAAALAALAEEVRGGLGRVDEVHAGLEQALKQQGEQIAEMGVEATRARMAVESVEARIAKLEQSIEKILRISMVVLLLMFVVASTLWLVMLELKGMRTR